MFANYHAHTWRCNHAKGKEEEYVLAALERKIKIFGFSDHAPYFYPGDYVSKDRMKPELLKDYCDTVLGLREKYEGQIEIPLGLEVEYYPDLFPQMLPYWKEHGIEYLLLGQHYVGNEIGNAYCGLPTSDVSVLKQYCAQAIEGMHTGLFTYLAHPDLIHFEGDEKVYLEHMRLICREAKQCKIPLEINMLGIGKGRNYPDRRFWELAAEEGCEVVIGIDAHSPEQILRADVEEKALQLAESLGLKVLEKVPLRKIN